MGHRNQFFHGVMGSDDHGILKLACQLVIINCCEVGCQTILTGQWESGGSTMYLRSRSIMAANDEDQLNKLPRFRCFQEEHT